MYIYNVIAKFWMFIMAFHNIQETPNDNPQPSEGVSDSQDACNVQEDFFHFSEVQELFADPNNSKNVLQDMESDEYLPDI